MKTFRLFEENLKFDLTTFGFNDQKSPVPSRSLNRVPTVPNFSFAGDGSADSFRRAFSLVASSRNSSGQAQERSEDYQKVLGPGRQKPSAETSPNETQRQQCQQRNYVQSYGKQQLNNLHHVLAVLTI